MSYESEGSPSTPRQRLGEKQKLSWSKRTLVSSYCSQKNTLTTVLC